MNKADWMKIVHDASMNRCRVQINFIQPVSIFLHKKLQPKSSKWTLRFFQLLDENNTITGYGYKQRSNEVNGYSIKSIPYDLIQSVEYPDKKVDLKHKRDVFKKWVLRNLDEGVWPNMEKNIDCMLDSLKPGEYIRMYTKSFGYPHELTKVNELFSERRSGTVVLSKKNNVFVETSQRENGFYAWLVIGERSLTMLNPNVAIVPRK